MEILKLKIVKIMAGIIGITIIIGLCSLISQFDFKEVNDVAEIVSVDKSYKTKGFIFKGTKTDYTTVIEYKDKKYILDDKKSYMIAKDQLGKKAKITIRTMNFSKKNILKYIFLLDICEEEEKK